MNHLTSYQQPPTNFALNRLRAAVGMIGILATKLASNDITREQALRSIALCKAAYVESASQESIEKEQMQLKISLRRGLAQVAELLTQNDPLSLLEELTPYLPPIKQS